MNVQHNKDKRQFEVKLDGSKAYMKYERKNDEVLDFTSTYVPEDERGEGLASEIVKKALEYARENKYVVIPTCPFVENYIEDHEEYKNLVRKAGV